MSKQSKQPKPPAKVVLEGFDFITVEKDASKKVEELASVVENVATIFLNGIGSLERMLDEMRTRLSKVETQVETLLRVGVVRAAPGAAGPGGLSEPSEAVVAPSPRAPALPAGPRLPPGPSEPAAPTSPLGAASGLGIQAQIQGELRSFLEKRRAVVESGTQSQE
jgi:hypothetical protein